MLKATSRFIKSLLNVLLVNHQLINCISALLTCSLNHYICVGLDSLWVTDSLCSRTKPEYNLSGVFLLSKPTVWFHHCISFLPSASLSVWAKLYPLPAQALEARSRSTDALVLSLLICEWRTARGVARSVAERSLPWDLSELNSALACEPPSSLK